MDFFKLPFFTPEITKNIENTASFKGDITSIIIYALFFGLIILASGLIYLFRTPILLNYKRKQTIFSLRKNDF
ncbi:UNVERIFIED_CONTAM: hypothetical protein O8I53_10620 [Campylobacter lari]